MYIFFLLAARLISAIYVGGVIINLFVDLSDFITKRKPINLKRTLLWPFYLKKGITG